MSATAGTISLSPLPPTASTLLRSKTSDGRTVMPILASDMMVSRAVCMIAEFMGFDGNLPHLFQTCGAGAIAQLAIALDLWISGSKTKSSIISASQLSLGSLVVGCLSPLAIDQNMDMIDAELQVRCASFGVFSTLAYALVARQWPEEFDRAATIAQFRQIPIAEAYRHVCGEPIRQTASKLAQGWNLTRELTIALAGPTGYDLSASEKIIISATQVATLAAQSAAVSIEPWPYIAESDSIEEMALIQAMGMRAKRLAASLEKRMDMLRSA